MPGLFSYMFKDMKIYEYCQRLIALKNKENQIFKIVVDNRTIKDLIVFLNTEQQMGEEHVDSLGQELFNKFTDRTTYSLFQEKRHRERAGKPYRLFDTGDYWDSFEAKVGNGFIVIKSDPRKGDDNIEDSFGNNLEGLTDESLKALIKLAHEFYVKWYRREILRA